jgi:hypothetical protein
LCYAAPHLSELHLERQQKLIHRTFRDV